MDSFYNPKFNTFIFVIQDDEEIKFYNPDFVCFSGWDESFHHSMMKINCGTECYESEYIRDGPCADMTQHITWIKICIKKLEKNKVYHMIDLLNILPYPIERCTECRGIILNHIPRDCSCGIC
jgi:mRNA deadenylase 3'-5' endonuclease subunit Ccr4